MENTIHYIVCTLILMIGSGIGGWWIRSRYKNSLISQYQIEIQALSGDVVGYKRVIDSMETTINKQNETIISQYTPEIIGEHVTEPESGLIYTIEDMRSAYYRGREDEYDVMQFKPGDGRICDKAHPSDTFNKWIQRKYHSVEPVDVDLQSAEGKDAIQQWRDQQSKQVAKDIDHRIAGGHQP